MSELMRRRALLSATAVIAAGCLLHFAWQWSGRSVFVAVIASTNESTWEHLKIAFWPALLVTPIQRSFYGPLPGWLPGTALRCLLPSLVIVGLFYGYTALLGAHYLVADLLIFAIAIVAGELLGHALLTRELGGAWRRVAMGVLVVSALLFATLTFMPRDCVLFDRPDVSPPVAN